MEWPAAGNARTPGNPMTRPPPSGFFAGMIAWDCWAVWLAAFWYLPRTVVLLGILGLHTAASAADLAPGWEEIAKFEMRGGLKAFWNVAADDRRAHATSAETRGFSRVTILNTFSDYPGRGRQSIEKFLGPRNSNPWQMPDYFETIVRRNIDISGGNGLLVHDIEFSYEIDPGKAWSDPIARRMSGAMNSTQFELYYWKKWAEWVTLPLTWSRQRFPRTPVGVFGFQPFYTETWNIKEQSAETIAFYHQRDINIWRHIEPHVDFVAVEAYLPSSDPGSLYYITLHMDANYDREKTLNNKPIYAYLWMRYYHTDWTQAVQQVDPAMVEAMAILPYFSGAKGVVLWGHEPQVKSGDRLPYAQLSTFVGALARLALLSGTIGKGTVVVDETAQRLWNQRRPIVRRIEVGDGECVAMAVNPFQKDSESSSVEATCSGRGFRLPTQGRRVTLAHIRGEHVMLH